MALRRTGGLGDSVGKRHRGECVGRRIGGLENAMFDVQDFPVTNAAKVV